MTKALAWVAMVALSVSLLSTYITICLQVPSKDDFLRLTQTLLSWPVIAGGLTVAGGPEIKRLLKRLAERGSHQDNG